jgi:hypothetical protein
MPASSFLPLQLRFPAQQLQHTLQGGPAYPLNELDLERFANALEHGVAPVLWAWAKPKREP